jgi:uncharacterized protein (TIGR00255 family)
MIRSMTGFGKAQSIVDSSTCTVEARSVNGRHLELSIRMPKEWADQESAMRDLVREKLSRGSINIYVRREGSATTNAVVVDHDLAKSFVAALRKMKTDLGLIGDVSIDTVASFTPIFEGDTEQVENKNLTSELAAVFTTALDALNTMREREGAEMVRDMEERLASVETHLAEVERISAERIPQEAERLRERIAQLVDEDTIDDQRLAMEIAVLADKLDISEEVVRLRSHIKHFRSDLDSGGVVGRRLNFQLQEMNREVNTMGSKSNDAEIARYVVHMKEELERMREQVQNVE